MKNKRILSLLLTAAMLFGICNIPALADNSITAYVTISQYGEIVTGKDGKLVAEIPVELTDKETYTIDDALYAVHEKCYDGGAAAGYGTGETQWGLSIAKLWGDTSYNFGYQVNGGTVSVWGPTDEISDGDYIDAFVYTDDFGEAYTKFNAMTVSAYAGEETELTLYAASYDANYNMVFSGCVGAELTINGEKVDAVTDENGKAVLTFDSAGTYVISAEKTRLKTVGEGEEAREELWTAITAPVCVVTVEDKIASITAYVTISQYGEIVTGKDGKLVAEIPVELTDKETYTIDDALYAVHEKCYDGGAAEGYGTGTSDWGLSITKLWGDTSYNFGYQVNGGTVSVMGPTHVLSDGDYIDAFVYTDDFAEIYTKFDRMTSSVYTGEETELTLYAVSSYDENWNMVFSGYEGAALTINGEKTDVVTDENGKAVLTFDNAGTYVISAEKTRLKTVGEGEEAREELWTAITAPVCVITVTMLPLEQLTQSRAVNTGTGYLVDVVCTRSIDNAVIIAALYDSDGRLVNVAEKKADGESEYRITAAYSDKKADHAKVFVWNGLDDSKPQSLSEFIGRIDIKSKE